jgi:predicted CoA-substrate-specific enzyme activase
MITVGIDIGSVTTKVAILKDRTTLVRLISLTGSNPKSKGIELFNEALRVSSLTKNSIDYVCATGYGRRSIDFANFIITEINACAIGAREINKDCRIIIDLGGQDSKIIFIDDNGKVKDFVMNDKCSAGTGKFLEVMANSLEVKLEDLDKLALESKNPIKINSTCTVFAQSEVISLLAQGKEREDIIAGLLDSIAERLVTMIGRDNLVGDVFFCGGGAKNKALKIILERKLNCKVFVPQEPQIVVAFGATLIGYKELEKKKKLK